MNPTLQEKFIGCIAGAQVGAAMGAITKGLEWQEIKEKYGYVDKLITYTDIGGEIHTAGTPGYDAERAKLIMRAIIENGDRARVEDVRSAWLKYGDLDAMAKYGDVFEAGLAALAKTDMPARDIGKYCDYSGLDTVPGAIFPVGLINAGNVELAVQDTFDIGQIYQISDTRSLQWAAAVSAAIAAASAPEATVETVLETVLASSSQRWVSQELGIHLEAVEGIKDVESLCTYFDEIYGGYATPFSDQMANEIITKAFCVFMMVEGNAKEAILAGANMGRNAACIASVSGAISGALNGSQDLPHEWIETVDAAASEISYSCMKQTIQESGEMMYKAFCNKLKKQQEFVREMDID